MSGKGSRAGWRYYYITQITYWEAMKTEELIESIKEEMKLDAEEVAKERNMDIVSIKYKTRKSEKYKGNEDLIMSVSFKDKKEEKDIVNG